METVLHKADSRGHFNHGWLKTSHTFSFAEYFHPDRIHFGALRVLNDDAISGGQGFGTHSHHNMEIVSIPLKGALAHRDSIGHSEVLRPGEIQVMSAGSGIRHSEYNNSDFEYCEFLQIWVVPDRQEVRPRYEHSRITGLLRKNELNVVVSPFPGQNKGLWIYQQAWFSLAELETGREVIYRFKSGESYGAYVFVIEGSILVSETPLYRRDGLGLIGTIPFEITALSDAKVLVMEVPGLR